MPSCLDLDAFVEVWKSSYPEKPEASHQVLERALLSTTGTQGSGGMGKKTGCLFPSRPPTHSHCLSLPAWARDSRHLLIPSASAHVYPVPWTPGPQVTWGRACVERVRSGSRLRQNLHMDYISPRAKPRHVGGRRRVKEILIYCSVMFIFTLGWLRAFFLNVLGSQFYRLQGCLKAACVREREREKERRLC